MELTMKTSYDVLAEARESVEEILAKILFIKKEGRNRAELRELFTQASLAFLNLRQINRVILQDEDRIKQETEAAKLPVDYTLLQLNNLLYEKNHYLKAISACKDFKSKYPDIELVPEDEFYRDAPAEFTKDLTLKQDSHKEMLERLNFELYQRKELCKHQELLEARKKMLQESVANRRKFVSSLPSHLKALKKASLSVQQQLGMLHSRRVKQHHLAELLAAPLYILYSQISAYKDAFDANIEVEIVGSGKDAQALARQQALKDSGFVHGSQEELKPDEDLQEEEEESQRRRKRTKRLHPKDSSDEGVFHTHPLSVLWHIYDELFESGKRIKQATLRFDYLVAFNIVCCGVEGERGGPLELLTNLFPNDTGLELPTQVSKLSAGVDFQYDVNRPSRPYKWAQHLSGIEFLSEAPPGLSDESSKQHSVHKGLALYRTQHRVQTVLEKVRRRKKAHLALKEQLDTLTSLKLPQCMYTGVPWGSYEANCYLYKWAEITQPESQKSVAFVDDASTAIVLPSSVEAMEVSSVNGLESAREDGELPSTVLTSMPSTAMTDYIELTERKYHTLRDRSQVNKHLSLGRAKGTLAMSGNSRSMVFEGLEAVASEDDDILLLLDISSEGEMDPVEAGGASTVGNFHKGILDWENCGSRGFNVGLRRDAGADQKAMELEAKVTIHSEYPIRPPHFSLCCITQGTSSNLVSTPIGVLNVSECLSCPASTSDPSFNELRTMEREVNCSVAEVIPPAHENEILAQQLSFLAMVFDVHVNQSDAADVLGVKATSRPIRGRGRQMRII